MTHYSVNDFYIYHHWEPSDRALECPYDMCFWEVSPYQTLGELLNAAEAHLLEKHSD